MTSNGSETESKTALCSRAAVRYRRGDNNVALSGPFVNLGFQSYLQKTYVISNFLNLTVTEVASLYIE